MAGSQLRSMKPLRRLSCFTNTNPTHILTLLVNLLVAFTLLINLAITQVASAQTSSGQLNYDSKPIFRHYTVSTGLPSEHVETIIQDKTGFLWFGTWNGLARYDGYKFKSYQHDPTDDKSLSDNSIMALQQDSSGYIWIATRNGNLDRFDPNLEIFTHYQIAADSLFLDHTGQLWASSGSHLSLNRFDPQTNSFKSYTLQGPDKCNFSGLRRIRRLLQDNSGTIWFAATPALYSFDPQTSQVNCYQAPQPQGVGVPAPSTGGPPAPPNGSAGGGSASPILINDVSAAPDGQFWVASNIGLYQFNPIDHQYTYEPVNPQVASKFNLATDKPITPNLNAITVDANGIVWVATSFDPDAALYAFDTKKGQFVAIYNKKTTDSSDDNFTILSAWVIFQDREGLIWIGSSNEGVNMLDLHQTQFKVYRGNVDSNNSFGNHAEAIYQQPDGIIWVGSTNLLVRFNPADNSFKTYNSFTGKLTDNLPPQSLAVSAIYPDGDTGLWFDGVDGLYHFDKKTEQFQRYFDPNMTTEKDRPVEIVYVAQDQQKNFWILSNNVIYYFDVATRSFVKHFAVNQDAPSQAKSTPANVLYVDTQNQLWVGGIGFLLRYEPQSGHFETHYNNFADTNTIPNSLINGIVEDNSGNIWLTTSSGLIKFEVKANKFTVFAGKAGFTDTNLLGTLKDNQGNLWISSPSLLYKFDIQTNIARSYNILGTGINSQYNFFSYYKNSAGQMFFGGQDNIVTFNPQNIKDENYQPPVILTDFKLRNDSVKVDPSGKTNAFSLKTAIWNTNEITLDHDQNFLTFSFAALGFSNPNNVLYRYKMSSGSQGDWYILDKGQRDLTFPNMSAGDYTLEIQGTNGDGVWSSNEVKLHIIITPPFWLEWWFFVICALGAFAIIYGIFRWRVSDIKATNIRLEKEVKERTAEADAEREKAIIANQAKSDFLANMSHELRTPLNGILGYTQILSRNSNLDTAQRDGLNIIYDSGRHLLTLINDVLDLAKIEARKLTLVTQSFNLAVFVDSVTGIFRLSAQQKNIIFVYQGSSNLPNFIQADEKRLRQVLFNLLGNAVKFTSNGKVTLRILTVSSDINASGGTDVTLRFEVEDTGVGIAPDQIEKIFLPFEQAGDSKQRAGGTGLGLAISQRLVELMGSEIHVESQLGKGSKFWFEATFPAEVAATNQIVTLKSYKDVIGYIGERKRILVVDDHLENRLVLLNLLSPLGFEVLMAENGLEGVKVAERTHPHLIFMDLVMPVMMGFEAVAAIRKLDGLASIPIIAVSASVLEIDHAQSQRVGCNGFVNKPIEVERIFGVLAESLNLTWTYRADEKAEVLTKVTQTEVQPEEFLASEELTPPDREDLEKLYELARIGNMERVQEFALDLEKQAPKYRSFARRVYQMADNFDDEQIQALVRDYLDLKL